LRRTTDLFVEVTTADGTRYKWNANEAAGSRPINLSFRSKIGEGFSDASLQLPRRIDLDYADLNLGDTVSIVGADGGIVYEGYVAAMPRELSDRHVIGVTLTGWMAHAKDRMFQEIYVDRDTGQWGDMPLEAQGAYLGREPHFDRRLLLHRRAGRARLPCRTRRSGAQTIARRGIRRRPAARREDRLSRNVHEPARPAGCNGSTHRQPRRSRPPISYTPTLDDTLRPQTLTTARRYVLHETYSNGVAATPRRRREASHLQARRLRQPRPHDPHAGDTTEPDGLYLSDILKNVAQRWCPLLDTSGVQDNPYVVQHCAFRDPVFPYDAFLELNKYALWHLGVWDNRQLSTSRTTSPITTGRSAPTIRASRSARKARRRTRCSTGSASRTRTR
jgi:hypothetical protein